MHSAPPSVLPGGRLYCNREIERGKEKSAAIHRKKRETKKEERNYPATLPLSAALLLRFPPPISSPRSLYPILFKVDPEKRGKKWGNVI